MVRSLLLLAAVASQPLAAADSATMSAPCFREPPIRQSDYPLSSLVNGRSVAALVDVATDPEGRVIDCSVIALQGDESTARSLCRPMKRSRLTPAYDEAGQPAYGVTRQFVIMAQPDTEQGMAAGDMVVAPDYELTVNTLPEAAGASLDVALVAAVDASGRVSSCGLRDGQATGLRGAAYVKVACDQVSGAYTKTMLDKSSVPVAYVRNFDVRFSTGALVEAKHFDPLQLAALQ